MVDDNEVDAEMFQRVILKSIPFAEISHYTDPEEALSRLLEDESSFDIVITDYNMPGMDGLELCNKLLNNNISLPVILLTGAGSENLAVDALKAGVDDYLIKDIEGGYLKLLPIVIPEVIKKYQNRIARIKAEEDRPSK